MIIHNTRQQRLQAYIHVDTVVFLIAEMGIAQHACTYLRKAGSYLVLHPTQDRMNFSRFEGSFLKAL